MIQGKKLGYIVSICMIAVAIGVSLAVEPASVQTDGTHILKMEGLYNDTGVGFFTFGPGSTTSDSNATGVFLRHVVYADTVLADTATGGSAKYMSGTQTGGSATLYAQTSDTSSRMTASLTFSDSANSTGTWSSTFSGGSGICTSVFLMQANMGTSSIATDSGEYALSVALATVDTARYAFPIDTKIMIFGFDTNPTTGDKGRVIVISPAGKIIGDSNLNAAFVNLDTRVVTPSIHFDSGVTTLVFILWDASAQKYVRIIRYVTVGGTSQPIAGGTGVAYLEGVGAISAVTVYANSIAPEVEVARIEINDVTNDAGPLSNDAFTQVDTNTSGFDTRIPNSVFEINLYDANGNDITKLPSGKSFLVVVQYGSYYENLSSIKLLHHVASTNSWEVVSNSSGDSTNRRIVAYVDKFSKFAIGNISSSSYATAEDDNCVINMTVGSTAFSSIMPTLRGVRDAMLTSSIGRFLVTGYYGFAAFMLLAAAGLGISKIRG